MSTLNSTASNTDRCKMKQFINLCSRLIVWPNFIPWRLYDAWREIDALSDSCNTHLLHMWCTILSVIFNQIINYLYLYKMGRQRNIWVTSFLLSAYSKQKPINLTAATLNICFQFTIYIRKNQEARLKMAARLVASQISFLSCNLI